MKIVISILCLGVPALSAGLNAQSCVPAITCFNGFAVNLLPASGPDGDLIADEYRVTVQATDLIRSASSPCNTTLQYRIRKAGEGTGVPSTTEVSFACWDIGTQPLEVWAGNGGNENWSYSETYVIVETPDGNCGVDVHSYSLSCGDEDDIPPSIQVFDGLAASLVPGPGGNASIKISASNLVYAKSDNCQGPVKLRISKDFSASVPATSSVIFDCDELGPQAVQIWAGDTHGNWASVDTYVFIRDDNNACGVDVPAGCSPDLTPPNVLAYNGFSTNVVPSPNGPVAKVYAKMFTRQRQDNCSPNLKMRIGKDYSNPATLPATTVVTFSCDELGTQPVYIWAGDAAGNWSRTETYVIVQDPFNSCGNAPRVRESESETTNLPPYANKLRQAEIVEGLSVRPNPTDGAFTLSGHLAEADFIQVELYNALGEQVNTLSPRQWQEAGDVHYTFELNNLPTGVYRCVLRCSTSIQSVNLLKSN